MANQTPDLMRWAPEMYLDTFLDGLGKISGYEELASVPLIPFGHSVGTSMPNALATGIHNGPPPSFC